MVTDAIDAPTRALLRGDGCLLSEVEPIRPAEHLDDHYANSRFAEVWTKLAVWRLTEFERVVFLDADMLVTQHMDELFSLDLAGGAIAACHACRCNPNRIPSYPVDWTPQNCAYTPGADVPDKYLNGGLLVLEPDEAVFGDMLKTLAEVDDLSRYPFAEQDFLNEYYDGRWLPLPYVYNALKTLPFVHPSLWDPAAVKNIHFIIDKPGPQRLIPRVPTTRWTSSGGTSLRRSSAAGHRRPSGASARRSACDRPPRRPRAARPGEDRHSARTPARASPARTWR